MPDLSRKRERDRLKNRRAPYWMRLSKGEYLGFRRGADTWHARYRDREGKQKMTALTGVDDYDAAKKAAEKWIREETGTLPVRKVRRGTVRDALETYLEWLREQGRESTARNALPKFKKVVWNDSISTIRLDRLTREDFREWRARLRDGRQPRSINRIVRDVQAGLNRARIEGFVGDPLAWKLDSLADDKDAGGETEVMLSPLQRKTLIESASPAGAAFFRGLELTGARPGELAKAKTGDFDRNNSLLKLSHKKGRPVRLRARSVVLSKEGAVFFSKVAKEKLPTASLFTDSNGTPWDRHVWSDEFNSAATKANDRLRGKNRIPNEASAYSFRHARISELLQIHGVDPLTVAAQTGTSLRMIERSYFRFIPAAMTAKLAAVDDEKPA